MATRIEANKAMKEEMKSFEMCVKMISVMKNLPDVKEYLKERVSGDFFTKKEKDGSLSCKSELFKYCKLHTFISANGVKYQAIYRKDKQGEIVEAKWSIWRILLAIDARHKALQKEQSKKEYAAKEKSIEEIESKESKDSIKSQAAKSKVGGKSKAA